MHKWSFLVLVAVFPMLSNAQIGIDSSRAISFLEPFEIPSGEEIVSIVQTTTAANYLITTKPGVLYLRPLNPVTGTPQKVLSIKSNDEKKIMRYELIGDSITCLVKTTNKDRSITFESVVYTLFNNQIAEASRIELGIKNGPNQKNAEKLHYRVSANGKYVSAMRLVSYEISPKALVKLNIVNHRADEITNHTLPIPFGADDIDITDMHVTNQGLVFFTATSGVKLNSPFLKKSLVYLFDPISKELSEFDLSKDKTYQQDLIARNKDRQLEILTTYTSDPMQQSSCNGFSYAMIDTNGISIEKKLISEFDDQLKLSLVIDARSNRSNIEHLFIDEICRIKEQSVGLFHQQYRDQVCTTDPRTGILSCTDQYHRDGIIVQFLHSDIKPIVINRVQIDYDQEGVYLGYTSAVLEEQLYILYNDHQKNTSTLAEREMSNPSRSNLRYVIVNEKGEMRSSAIDLNLERGFILLPGVKGFEKNGKIVRLYSNGRDFRIGEFDTEIIATFEN